MKHTRGLAHLTLALVSGIACTTSSAQRGPAASVPNDSASDPGEVSSNLDGTDARHDTPAEPRGVSDGPADRVQPAGSQRPIAVPNPSGPYRVRIVDAAMHDLRLFHRDGRSYMLGTVGDRYSVVLSNPTPRRVEAVISIDGLDAIDGTTADYVSKRGYILPAYGNATIEGFRTSIDQVATFRFSSVADSYAGRKGQARDVGVIGVAFFPERAFVSAPPVAVRPYNDRFDDLDGRQASAGGAPHDANRSAPSPSKKAEASAPSAASADVGALAGESSSAVAPTRDREERRGLGTEFGEARESHVEETEFVRANATLPSDIVTFRYNDRAGLVALGIRVDPPAVADAELRTRETADPFRANRFAAPPP
jgi:hypothetical protein